MNTSPRIDFDRINAVALTDPGRLLSRWLPGGRINGAEFVAGSLEGEAGRSLSINLASGVWKEFAGGEGGSDLVSLYAAIFNLGQAEAARRLAEELGVDPGGNGAALRLKAAPGKPSDDWRPILPAPDDAPEPDFKHYQHGKAVAHWSYRDGEGRLLGYACRFEPPGGRKEILPLTFCRNGERREWRYKSFPAPRPLYGLDRLAAGKPEAPVLILEGEKTADAAGRLVPGAICLTWPGGCNAVGKADFSPVRGRRVAIWPDADKPGHEAAQAVAASLKEAGAAEVSIVDPPAGVPAGWDLADAEAEGWDVERVKAHIREHKQDPTTGAGQENPRAFRFLPLSELLAAPRPTRWLIRDHIEADTLGVLFGESGAMKSFLALDQGLCIASGTLWHGQAIPNPGPVFYLAGEGHSGIGKRIQAWLNAHGLTHDAIPFFVSNAPAQLLDADHARQVADAVAALAEQHGPPRLVVVDTLNRNFGPGDENSSADMTAFVAALDKLKARFGCTVEVVHHSGLADKNRSRGSSVLKAAADFEYQLTVKDRVRILSCTKSKDHEPPADMAFEPEPVELSGWIDTETLETMTSCVLCQVDMPEDGKTSPSLPKGARIALEAIQAICPPGGSVARDAWAEKAIELGLCKSDKPASQWEAFKRAKDRLLSAGLVTFHGDNWSLAECSPHNPQNPQTSTNAHFVDAPPAAHNPQTSTRFFRSVDFVDVDEGGGVQAGGIENPFGGD